MLTSHINRRDLLKGGASLTALAGATVLGGCERILEQIANRPTRYSITDPAAAADLATYDAAVAAMKALPATDPRNWTRQAEIHLNFCPHGNWYFLPWHRAYLFYFEQICREVTGVEDFALPYWNWQVDRAIPAQFWSGNLNHSPRSATSSSMASTSFTGSSVLEGILDLTNFEQFASYASTALRGGVGGGYGELEQTPHNYIHGFVGGTMGGFTSPEDPIFWCHHNMIDCMWDRWNNARGNLNTSDPAWTQFDLAGMFVDGTGAAASVTCGITGIMPLLSYQFGSSLKGQLQLVANPIFTREVLEKGGNIRHQIKVSQAFAENISIRPGRSASRKAVISEKILSDANGRESDRILLRAKGLSSGSSDMLVRVFVNTPNATSETPTTAPGYAGAFAFFLDGMARMPMDYYVDVTDTVAKMQKAGMLSAGETIELTLVTERHMTGNRRSGTVAVRALDLVTTPAAVRGK